MGKENIKSEIKKSNRKILDATRYKLWAISGGRCQLCNKIVYTDSTFGKDGNFGELAHIHAVGQKGPRHWKDMSLEELNSTSNLMLMCQEHHKMIDDNPELFPAMPSSLAVRLGQDFMKKTDPMISIYDQDGDVFIETITIGGESYER